LRSLVGLQFFTEALIVYNSDRSVALLESAAVLPTFVDRSFFVESSSVSGQFASAENGIGTRNHRSPRVHSGPLQSGRRSAVAVPTSAAQVPAAPSVRGSRDRSAQSSGGAGGLAGESDGVLSPVPGRPQHRPAVADSAPDAELLVQSGICQNLSHVARTFS